MKIAIYLTGNTYADISCRYGGFEDWFAREVTKHGAETVTFDVQRSEYPDLDRFDGSIITGSPSSVCTNPEPWTETLIEHLQNTLDMDYPTLGVCFGHQILAKAAGATVQPHENGREIGTVSITKTPEGKQHPLFEEISAEFKAQETHEDVVMALPGDKAITVLAGNDFNRYQALAYSPHIFSVQFHPEITADIMQMYHKIYGTTLVEEGKLSRGEYTRISESIEETGTGETLIRNFLDFIPSHD